MHPLVSKVILTLFEMTWNSLFNKRKQDVKKKLGQSGTKKM
jgi:hypothetical protein